MSTDVLEKINNAATPTDLAAIYDASVSASVSALYAGISRTDLESAVERWACALHDNDVVAVALNRHRKIALTFAYRLYNLVIDKDAPTVEAAIAAVGEERLQNILAICVPMDRANSLYNMQPIGAAHPGMHWYADEHATALGSTLDNYTGFATINKRLLWYAARPKMAALRPLLQPTIMTTTYT